LASSAINGSTSIAVSLSTRPRARASGVFCAGALTLDGAGLTGTVREIGLGFGFLTGRGDASLGRSTRVSASAAVAGFLHPPSVLTGARVERRAAPHLPQNFA
jgi:hypothetical protein